MTGGSSNSGSSASLPPMTPATTPARRRPNTTILMVPILGIIITFLFWYQTWFGRRLSDREMGEYLADTSVPHKTQHALAQMAERMAQRDQSVKQWYPRVLTLARNPEPEFRLTAAWVMGEDNSSAEFHQALRDSLQDPEPEVRWNAALALVRFGDSAGEAQLRTMLRPYTLQASKTGTLDFLMKKGEDVNTGSVIARLNAGSKGSPAKPEDIRSPLAGEIQDLLVPEGATVERGQPLAVLSPGAEQAWECLRGLYFVGGSQDLEEIESYVRSTPQLPERVRLQAAITLQAIRSRMTIK